MSTDGCRCSHGDAADVRVFERIEKLCRAQFEELKAVASQRELTKCEACQILESVEALNLFVAAGPHKNPRNGELHIVKASARYRKDGIEWQMKKKGDTLIQKSSSAAFPKSCKMHARLQKDHVWSQSSFQGGGFKRISWRFWPSKETPAKYTLVQYLCTDKFRVSTPSAGRSGLSGGPSGGSSGGSYKRQRDPDTAENAPSALENCPMTKVRADLARFASNVHAARLSQRALPSGRYGARRETPRHAYVPHSDSQTPHGLPCTASTTLVFGSMQSRPLSAHVLAAGGAVLRQDSLARGDVPQPDFLFNELGDVEAPGAAVQRFGGDAPPPGSSPPPAAQTVDSAFSSGAEDEEEEDEGGPVIHLTPQLMALTAPGSPPAVVRAASVRSGQAGGAAAANPPPSPTRWSSPGPLGVSNLAHMSPAAERRVRALDLDSAGVAGGDWDSSSTMACARDTERRAPQAGDGGEGTPASTIRRSIMSTMTGAALRSGDVDGLLLL